MNDDVEAFINAWFYFFDSILDPAFTVFITSFLTEIPWEYWDLMHFGERNTHCFVFRMILKACVQLLMVTFVKSLLKAKEKEMLWVLSFSSVCAHLCGGALCH